MPDSESQSVLSELWDEIRAANAGEMNRTVKELSNLLANAGVKPQLPGLSLVNLLVESGWAAGRTRQDIYDLIEGLGLERSEATPPSAAHMSATVLACTGHRLEPGRDYVLSFGAIALDVLHPDSRRLADALPYNTISTIDLDGGTETTGGGFIGGGFGLDGALIGILGAAALNALTTRTSIKTVLHITTDTGEVFFLHTETEPFGLRLSLSHAFTAVRLSVEQGSKRPNASQPLPSQN